jgi:hypothetical protein
MFSNVQPKIYKDLIIFCDQTSIYNKLNFPSLFNKEMYKDEHLHNIVNEIAKPKVEKSTFEIKHYSYLDNKNSKLVNILEYNTDSFLSTGQILGDNDINNVR